jgi:hypothetical protein
VEVGDHDLGDEGGGVLEVFNRNLDRRLGVGEGA